MTKLNKNDKIKQELLEPLPSEALKQHPTRKYLTTINSIYVIERLNDVFGLEGWKAKYEVVFQDDNWVVAKCFLTAGEIAVEQYGGNDNPDIGDRFKGACTDALTKCGSYIGVGSHVWKNKYVSILDGHNLRFCIKCNFVWEGPWDKRDGVTIIKYSNLSSYRLKRKQCYGSARNNQKLVQIK